MAYMDSSRRDLYFELYQTRVVGGLAELGSGGRKEDLVYAATPALLSLLLRYFLLNL